MFWTSIGFCLALSPKCPLGSPCHHSPHGDFVMQAAGQQGIAEPWEPSEFGGFLLQRRQKLLLRHLQRDKSLQGPMVEMAPQIVLCLNPRRTPAFSWEPSKISHMHKKKKIQNCFIHLMSRSKRETWASRGPHQHVAPWDSFPLGAWGVNRGAMKSQKEL